MARGRMLNKKISLNEEVAILVNELGGNAGIVFTWMISHLDCEGRMSGNPNVVRSMVCPMAKKINASFVDKVLDRSHDLGLLVRYESQGKRYIEFTKFTENQVGLRKDREQPSEIPGPNSEEITQDDTDKKQVAYFIKGKTTGLIKIGKSVDPVRRLAQLQAGASEDMELLAVGGDESELHERFKEYCVHGEWFRPSDDIMEEVRLRSGGGPAPVPLKRSKEKLIEVEGNGRESLAPSCDKPAASEPAILTMGIVGKNSDGGFAITDSMIKEWARVFPGVDVLAEVRRAAQWCKDNPARRKTRSGSPAFLNRWLSKAQNQSTGPQGKSGPKGPGWKEFTG